jgi:hypothetical protein
MTPQHCLKAGLYRYLRCFNGIGDGNFAVPHVNVRLTTRMMAVDAKITASNRRIRRNSDEGGVFS